MRQQRKNGIYPNAGLPFRILTVGIYHPEDLVADLTPYREGNTFEENKAAFLDSPLYWGSMPFIPWLEAFDDRPKTPEDIERIEEHKRRTIAREKLSRERKADAMLSRGTLTTEQAARMKAMNRWERAVADGLPRPKNPKRWRTIK